jgi:hypothetical protein
MNKIKHSFLQFSMRPLPFETWYASMMRSNFEKRPLKIDGCIRMNQIGLAQPAVSYDLKLKRKAN